MLQGTDVGREGVHRRQQPLFCPCWRRCYNICLPVQKMGKQAEMAAKTDRMSDQIAALALGLSILSSGFAVYQWWSSSRDEHIRSAIELSDRYIDQAIDKGIMVRQFEMGQLNSLDMIKVSKQDARIEYISLLERNGLVNADYLSQRIICDILRSADPQASPEAEKFKGRHPKACAADAALEPPNPVSK